MIYLRRLYIWILFCFLVGSCQYCGEKIVIPDCIIMNLPDSPPILPNNHNCYSTTVDIVYKYEYPLDTETGQDIRDSRVISFWDVYMEIPEGVDLTRIYFVNEIWNTDQMQVLSTPYSSTPVIIPESNTNSRWDFEKLYSEIPHDDTRINVEAKVEHYDPTFLAPQSTGLPATSGRKRIATLVYYPFDDSDAELTEDIQIYWSKGLHGKPGVRVCEVTNFLIKRRLIDRGYYLPKLTISPQQQSNEQKINLNVTTNDYLVFPTNFTENSEIRVEELYFDPSKTTFEVVITELEDNNVSESPSGDHAYLGSDSDLYDNSINSYFDYQSDHHSMIVQKCSPIKELDLDELGLKKSTFYAIYLNYKTSKQNVLSNIKIVKTNP